MKQTVDILSPIDVERYGIRTGNGNYDIHFVIYGVDRIEMLYFYRNFFLSKFRWYYTSDTVVKEVTIDEVLSVSAYMLFYDRGTGPSRQQM